MTNFIVDFFDILSDMTTILLILIYLAFISLGLPDSLLGSSWPIAHLFFKVDVSTLSYISIVTSGSTVISSLYSTRFMAKFKTVDILWVSTLLTVIGLLGVATSSHYWQLILWMIPYGLGAGNIDTSLNNYVARNLESRHMSWLHSCWGIGASTGPLILAFFLSRSTYFQGAFFVVAGLQSLLMLTMFFSKSQWNKADHQTQSNDEEIKHVSNKVAFKTKKVKHAMLSFFVYVAMEGSINVWAASYCVNHYNFSADTAAKMVALFFFSLTFGRIFDGFLSLKMNNINRLRLGQMIGLIGLIGLILSNHIVLISLSFILMGFGFATQYPTMMHETPHRFGDAYSAAVISLQISSAYLGFIIMSLGSGAFVSRFGLDFLPYFMLSMMLLLIYFTQSIQSHIQKQSH